MACLPCTAADLLRLDGLIAPKQAPAGVAVPFSATFTLLEPISAGWRVGADLIPAAGVPKYSEGPANSPFGPATETGATRTVSFSVAVPSDAAPGIYRIAIDHYTKRDDRWVHVRYQDADGNLTNFIPDFVVKRNSRERFFVETKGLEDKDVPLKMARLKQWCEDINRKNLGFTFDFAFVDEESFKKYRPRSFEELLRMFKRFK